MPPRRLRKRTIVAVPTARNTRGRNAGQEEMATALAAANTSGTPTPVTQADATPVSTGAPAIALAPVPALTQGAAPAPSMVAALLQVLQAPGNASLVAALVSGLAPPAGAPPTMATQATPTLTTRPPGVLRNTTPRPVAASAPPAAGQGVSFLNTAAAATLFATGAVPRVLDPALAAAAGGLPTGTPATATTTMTSDEETVETTLVEALKWTVTVGGENDDIAADLAFQGNDKPVITTAYRDAMTSLAEASPAMTMTEGVASVTLVHSLFQHHAPARNRDEYADAVIGFVGDREGDVDPTAVKIKPGLITWREVTLVADYGDNSAMDIHYSDAANKYTFFDATNEPKSVAKVNIPKLPTPPAEIALKILQTPTTPWELLGLIEAW